MVRPLPGISLKATNWFPEPEFTHLPGTFRLVPAPVKAAKAAALVAAALALRRLGEASTLFFRPRFLEISVD